MSDPPGFDPFTPPRAGVGDPTPIDRRRGIMYAQSLATGLILGLIDIQMSNTPFLLVRLGLYTTLAAYQGWRYGRRAVLSVVLLGSSLAPIQMVAITCGYRYPYVCHDRAAALALLLLNLPCQVGFWVGRLARRRPHP